MYITDSSAFAGAYSAARVWPDGRRPIAVLRVELGLIEISERE
jgi:hypothetical protein